MSIRHFSCLYRSAVSGTATQVCGSVRIFLRLQHLMDPALPEDIEDGLDEDTVTLSIGEALDHIGASQNLQIDACWCLFCKN